MKPTIPENVTWKNLASGVVLLDLKDGTYYLLNDTASTAWRGILDGKAAAEVAEDFLDEYDCSREQAEADVEELFDHFRDEGLLAPCGSSLCDS